MEKEMGVVATERKRRAQASSLRARPRVTRPNNNHNNTSKLAELSTSGTCNPLSFSAMVKYSKMTGIRKYDYHM